MNYGVVAINAPEELIKDLIKGNKAYGISSTKPTEFLCMVSSNEPHISKLIKAWRIAKWHYEKSNRKKLFVANCPEGTCNEFAPKPLKSPPKRPDNKVNA